MAVARKYRARRAKKPRKAMKARAVVHRRVPRPVNGRFGFPSTRVCRMRFCKYFFMASTLGSLGTYTFLANQIYRPDGATAHDAQGFDQWKNFYNCYVVIGSKATLKIIGLDNTSTGMTPAAVTLQLNDDATMATSYLQAAEQGGIAYRLVNGESDKQTSLRKGFSAKKFFNVAQVKDNFDRLGTSNFTTNVANQAYFIVGYQSMDGTSGSSAYAFMTVDYTVLFSEPKDLAQSIT